MRRVRMGGEDFRLRLAGGEERAWLTVGGGKKPDVRTGRWRRREGADYKGIGLSFQNTCRKKGLDTHWSGCSRPPRI